MDDNHPQPDFFATLLPGLFLDAGAALPPQLSIFAFSTVNVTMNGSFVNDSATPSNSISDPGSIFPGSAESTCSVTSGLSAESIDSVNSRGRDAGTIATILPLNV